VYMDAVLNFSCMACGKCCRNDWQVIVGEESYQRNAELFLKVGTQAEFLLTVMLPVCFTITMIC
jgi:Fe-S-cluster containining protein